MVRPTAATRLTCSAVLVVAVWLTGCQSAQLAPVPGESTPAATPTPASAPPDFAADVYPSPLPIAEGVVLAPLSAGCPSLAGLATDQPVPLDAVLETLAGLGSGDLDAMRRVSDPALWPVLKPGDWREEAWPPDWVDTPQPATAAPHADLLASACGREIVDRSWWVRLCPGPCSDPNVNQAASLMGHLYLIERKGHWLVWAAE